ncbi:rod shape-determining protein MreD [Halobacillus salinarum]|uniref:Rod shape-determining protein MreD n=1 Tax=Halobacillus salinarum TaxID=2932257 RepID=A0ABY4EQJ6_9BACI|nr:rod shape-determining protein MreD [Halobacillus salinarum]UOQ46250.1 rod shape-determining protein MreD [Halobacillus salinarum]
MSRYLIALILLILVALQGMAMNLLPSSLVYTNLLITPHWALCFILLLAIFYDNDRTYHSLWFGLLFGLLIDVAYTGVLGVYMVTYGFVAYTIHGLTKLLHANFLSASLLIILGVALADTLLFIIYSFVQVASMAWSTYALQRLLPTLAANMIFFVIIYPIMKNRIVQWSEDIHNA